MFRQLGTGALAGFVATAPMTAVMALLHRRLPRHERYPMPPALLMASTLDKFGLNGRREPRHARLSYLSHFGFGAFSGSLYPFLAGRLPLPSPVRGLIFGAGVWTTSYLGWIPAFRLLTPATRHPRRRTLIMIGTNLLWGALTAVIADQVRRALTARTETSEHFDPTWERQRYGYVPGARDDSAAATTFAALQGQTVGVESPGAGPAEAAGTSAERPAVRVTESTGEGLREVATMPPTDSVVIRPADATGRSGTDPEPADGPTGSPGGGFGPRTD